MINVDVRAKRPPLSMTNTSMKTTKESSPAPPGITETGVRIEISRAVTYHVS